VLPKSLEKHKSNTVGGFFATISKRKTGWQAQIRRIGFPPLSKHFSTSSEAKAWARETESEMDRGLFVDRSEAERTTLEDILKRYRNEVTPSKRGCKQEKSRINVILNHPITRRSLASLRSSDFATYRDERLQHVSGTTVIKEVNLLAHVIDTARRDWSIHMDNPVRLIKRPKANRARDRRLHPGEEEKLLISTDSRELKNIIRIALQTAMRRGEILGMRWKHIDFEKRILFIPETKTDAPRFIPLSTDAMAVLRSLPRRIDGRVFGVRPQSVTQAFERACNRAEILDLTFHDLRHEATSRLFERGLNPMQVAAITGHKTLQMLKRYTHLKAENLVAMLG
jgi:integrase